MNACLHTQTQKPGKGENTHKALSALMSALTKQFPWKKGESERRRQTDLISFARKEKKVRKNTEKNKFTALLFSATNATCIK